MANSLRSELRNDYRYIDVRVEASISYGSFRLAADLAPATFVLAMSRAFGDGHGWRFIRSYPRSELRLPDNRPQPVLFAGVARR